MIALLLAVLLTLPAQAQEVGQFNSSCFLGLNDADTPATLGPCESPDLLNTESNLDGTAILKRKGFSKFADLTVATSAVNGSHSFIDSSGNTLTIVCHDRICSKSTNGNAFATFITSAAADITRWSFVDQGGILYGANSKRDPILKYDGTTLSYPSGMPAGSIIELTQDRLAVGDISGLPNRVHYSSAGAYEQFTIGVNPEDSFFDDIGAPGDRIRGIKCIGGICFIFKTASITLCEMDDQYNTQCSVISPNIGTTDPASIVAAGSILYFRAQDKNYWSIDRGSLVQISKKIPNLVKSQSGGLGGGENTNTQTTKADWQAGTQKPTASFNTDSINGSIFPSTVTFTDTSGTDFASSTLVGVSTNNISGSLTLLQSTFSFSNGDFQNETVAGGQPSVTNWTMTGWVVSGDKLGDAGICGYATSAHRVSVAPNLDFATYTTLIEAMDGTIPLKSCEAVYNCAVIPCAYVSSTCDGVQSVVDTVNGKNGKIFTINTSTLATGSLAARLTTNGFVEKTATSAKPQQLSIQMGSWDEVGFGVAFYAYACATTNYVSSGRRTSPIFDTAYSTPVWGPLSSTYTALNTTTEGNVAFYTQSSSVNDGTGFGSLVSSSDTLSLGSIGNKRYIRSVIDLTTSVSTKTPSLQAVSLLAATTGQFVSQCIQPNASIASWGTLSCAQTLAGNGSLVYYATSAVTCAGLPSTPPVNSVGALQSGWTTQTNNATVTIATNSAVLIGWRSLLGSATDQAQVDACVLAWNEGTPAQPSWATFDSVKNAIYWTATVNGASSTNRLLKYDLNLEGWFPFNIPAQAPRVINNGLYFGGASSGTWNTYGLVDSDSGGGINGYWTTKDFGSDRPFNEKNFQTASVLTRNNGSGILTGTWTNSIGTTGTWDISLSTGTGIVYARSLYRLPQKSAQQFMRIKLGNSSSTPFEVLGLSVNWFVLPWKVSP